MGSILLLTLLAMPINSLANSPTIYHISFDGRDHNEALVTVTFTDVANSPLEIRMSRTSPGRYALHEFAKNVYHVEATDSRGRALNLMQPNLHQWNVSGHDGTVKMSYTIFGDRSDGTYLAIDNTHAHMNIPATFMWARGLEDRPITVTFEVPQSDWQIATQLVPTERPDTFTAPDLAYFMDSPTEISALKMHEWEISTNGARQTIRLAIHHDGSEEETAAYAELCQAVVAEQLAIFREAPKFDYGTYTFIADYLPHVNGDGMEHRNSTILSSSRALEKQAIRNLGTVSHEFFHAWNVERLRPKSLEPFDLENANMSGELWFAEGFTSYYGVLTLRRAKVTNLDRFSKQLGAWLNSVMNAPGRTFFSPVEMSRKAPFVDAARSIDPKNYGNTFVSYYTYGAVTGLGLDLMLRRQFPGLSLDNFMRTLWRKHGKTEIPYTNADLSSALGETTGDVRFADQFFKNYIYGKDLVDFAALLSQAGLLLRKDDETAAWMGNTNFDYKDEKVTVSTSTRIGSPLYLAGVGRHDIILEIGGKSFQNKEELDDLLKEYAPGDTAQIKFEKGGVEKSLDLVFQANPTFEVVPFEQAEQSVTTEMLKFREEWLGKKSEFETDRLKRYCPKCRRAFAMEKEYCWYDGEELGLTPKPDKPDKPAIPTIK